MKPLLIHFAKTTVDALKAEQVRTGCSVSEFIRRAVAEALKKATQVCLNCFENLRTDGHLPAGGFC